MNHEEKVREVREDDINRIYEICKQVELTNNPIDATKYGFLIKEYSKYPETKDKLKIHVNNSYFCLYEENNVLGFILGFSEQKRRGERTIWGDSNVKWNSEKLEELGIQKIDDIIANKNFAMIERIAVEPKSRRRGIGSNLFNHFFKEVQEDKIRYVFSKIIEEVFKEGKPLGMKNEASIKAHQRVGMNRVGESKEPWRYDKSFLGDKGTFLDGVYLIDLKR